LQVQVHVVEVRAPQELDNAFSALRSMRTDALIMLMDPMFMSSARV